MFRSTVRWGMPGMDRDGRMFIENDESSVKLNVWTKESSPLSAVGDHKGPLW